MIAQTFKSIARYKRLSLAMAAVLSLPAWAADPMNIDELIVKGVETHPLVGSAMADEQASKEGITAAKLSYLPTPSIGAGEDPETGGITSSLTVRQSLWTGGQLTANVNQAIYDHKAAEASVYEKKNEVAKNIIDVWQSYIYSVALQELYVRTLTDLRSFEAMMGRRVSQGVSARIELDVVKNRILQDYNAHQSSVEQQKIAEARLEQMIGEKLHKTNNKIPLALLAKYAEGAADYYGKLAFADASHNNPSVIRQRYAVESARQAVKAQQASRYPKLFVQYQYIYNHKERRTKGDWTWGLSYDPGAGFSNIALERASRARVQGLVHSQEAARRTAMESIQTQYQQFISTKDQQASLIAAIKGAKIVAESYQRQFIAGRKTWLEVLNAVREHAQYQQQLLQVQSQMVANFYKLQVDFGLMPWQVAGTSQLSEVSEFHPTAEFTKIVRHWQASLDKPDEELNLQLEQFPEDGTHAIEFRANDSNLPAVDTPTANIANASGNLPNTNTTLLNRAALTPPAVNGQGSVQNNNFQNSNLQNSNLQNGNLPQGNLPNNDLNSGSTGSPTDNPATPETSNPAPSTPSRFSRLFGGFANADPTPMYNPNTPITPTDKRTQNESGQ